MARQRTGLESEFSRREFLAGTGGALIGMSALGLADPAAAAKKHPQRGGTLLYGSRSDTAGLDGHRHNQFHGSHTTSVMYTSLTDLDYEGNIIPGIAESWEPSKDLKSWVFKLRQGVSFHNGREVTAKDVVYSFTRLMDPGTNSPSAWLFERVKGVEAFRAETVDHIEGLVALDKYTVEITLSQPYVPFIRMLGIVHARVVPEEEIVRLGDDFRRHPIGTGPFRFVRWVPGQEIVLQANESYFEGRPFIDELHYRIFPGSDREVILAEFEDGKLEDAQCRFQIANGCLTIQSIDCSANRSWRPYFFGLTCAVKAHSAISTFDKRSMWQLTGKESMRKSGKIVSSKREASCRRVSPGTTRSCQIMTTVLTGLGSSWPKRAIREARGYRHYNSGAV